MLVLLLLLLLDVGHDGMVVVVVLELVGVLETLADEDKHQKCDGTDGRGDGGGGANI